MCAALSMGRQSADNLRMWLLVAGIAGTAVVIILTVRNMHRAARRQQIEVGAVSEGWIAQHRGSRQG